MPRKPNEVMVYDRYALIVITDANVVFIGDCLDPEHVLRAGLVVSKKEEGRYGFELVLMTNKFDRLGPCFLEELDERDDDDLGIAGYVRDMSRVSTMKNHLVSLGPLFMPLNKEQADPARLIQEWAARFLAENFFITVKVSYEGSEISFRRVRAKVSLDRANDTQTFDFVFYVNEPTFFSPVVGKSETFVVHNRVDQKHVDRLTKFYFGLVEPAEV